MIDKPMKELRERVGEIFDIHSASAVLHWDQQTYMPRKGAEGRASQLATLSALAHRMFTSPEVGGLLQELWAAKESLSPDDAKFVEETHYDYRKATCFPEAFVHDLSEAESRAFEAWQVAHKQSDFQVFRPHLEKLVEFQKRKIDYLGFKESPYDALLEDFERGMTANVLKRTFTTLAERQSALVERLLDSPNQPKTDWLKQTWNEQAQWDFGMKVLADLGYDLEAGRQDKSAHPFSTSFGLHDVRITTRVHADDLFSSLASTLHECGHALYEQGFCEEDNRGTLGQACSLGMHESQSRMWENLIGRSLPFWKRYTADLRKAFPGQLEGRSPEDLYRANNRVERSLIRVEADECTYNLHVILRFEIEIGLIEGDLKVAEIPDIWNAKMKQYLGLEVPDDAQGCLQDVHWSSACFGYFPTYALGNLYAAQMFEVILREIPDLWKQVEEGRFEVLLEWLRRHVHCHGRRKTASEIMKGITGEGLDCEPYLRYLENKYGQIYGLS